MQKKISHTFVILILCFCLNHCSKNINALYKVSEINYLNSLKEKNKNPKVTLTLDYLIQSQQKMKQGFLNQAELLLLKALELNEKTSVTAYYLAKNEMLRKNYHNALSQLMSINAYSSLYYKYKSQLLQADAYYEQNNKHMAIKAYKKALKMRAKDDYVKQRLTELMSDTTVIKKGVQ